jgi:hypothetical protein
VQKRSASKKELDAQAALVCGEAFQRLAQEFIPRIDAIRVASSPTVSNELGDLVACATNIGFALELYLKGLLMQLDLPVPKVHDLRTLYDAIPQSVRALMEGVYDTSLLDQLNHLPGGRVGFTLARGPADEPLWDDHTKRSPALPDLLARSRDLFQSWRYVFEHGQQEGNPYQFHNFEYGHLWCAAEAIRAEFTVRLRETGEAPRANLLEGES